MLGAHWARQPSWALSSSIQPAGAREAGSSAGGTCGQAVVDGEKRSAEGVGGREGNRRTPLPPSSAGRRAGSSPVTSAIELEGKRLIA
jgi:hypothetical protein